MTATTPTKRKTNGKATPVADKYAATAWGNYQSSQMDLELPSGQLCLIRMLDMPDLIRLDIVNEVDFISGAMSSDEADAASEDGASNDDGLDFLRKISGDDFARLLKTIDKITLESVIKPAIHAAPVDKLGRPLERKDGVIYVDQIDFMDRMTIFNAAFQGLGDMSAFREEQADGVGAVAEVEGPAV